MLDEPKCYSCAHRRNLTGKAHYECLHPVLRMARGEALMTVIRTNVYEDDAFRVEFTAHGVSQGRVAFPHAFDPNYLVSCTAHQRGRAKRDVVLRLFEYLSRSI